MRDSVSQFEFSNREMGNRVALSALKPVREREVIARGMDSQVHWVMALVAIQYDPHHRVNRERRGLFARWHGSFPHASHRELDECPRDPSLPRPDHSNAT